MYAWLLAATRKPVTAIASYDGEAALKLCLAFGRTGISTSHFRTLATPAKVRKFKLTLEICEVLEGSIRHWMSCTRVV